MFPNTSLSFQRRKKCNGLSRNRCEKRDYETVDGIANGYHPSESGQVSHGSRDLSGANVGKIENFEDIEAWKKAQELARQEKLKLTGGDK